MDLKIFAKTIDDKSREQVNTLCSTPAFKDAKVRIMCDVHAGMGSVIGFTANLGDKVIPNVVGVDIGCGMLTVPLGNIAIDFQKLDATIYADVPHGMGNTFPTSLEMHSEKIDNLYCLSELDKIQMLHHSTGTLGGGNHFIEVDADESGEKYLVIHTGSRNLGKQVADLYQEKAIKMRAANYRVDVANYLAELKASGEHNNINALLKKYKESYFDDVVQVPRDLCYLDGQERLNYLHDMKLCQEYAHDNRAAIAQTICSKMGWMDACGGDGVFETVHNYIDHESNIVRKGAIRAKAGEKVLIPINMRDGSIIGTGQGNADWNESAPHGAGRLMSRKKAQRTLSLDDYKKAMEGIFTSCVCQRTIDESPMAYKDMNEIVSLITPTVHVDKIIKPVYNFKAVE